MTVVSEDRPYKPSWIDLFTSWIDELPGRMWVPYVVVGIVLTLVQMLFLWFGGGQVFGPILPVMIYNALAIPYVMAVIHVLDHQAVTALNAMRPMLDTTESEFDHYEYRLANMPFRVPLIAGLALMAIIILMERVSMEPVRLAALQELPVFAVVYHIIDKGSGYLLGVFIYHTIRQLRLVNTINSSHIRINLFHLKPLQAFSTLTGTAAVGMVVAYYAFILINPELLTDPVLIGFTVVVTILAVSIFVWPLYGAHRLMESEKERALHDIGLRLGEVFSKLDQNLGESDYSAIETLNGTISSLDTQHRIVKAIPTWPWRSETAGVVLTTIAIPLVLMLLQFIVEGALGR